MSLRRLPRIALFVAGSVTACLSLAAIVQEQREGYRTTPILPNQKWHVHDPDRPYPAEVNPGPALGSAPSDAIVLFDGKDLSQWMQLRGPDGSPSDPKWKIENGEMVVNGGTGDLYTKEKFGDCQLHIEWQEPTDIEGRGQARGNSGVFLMSRYEVQVLDSYRAATYADGQAGAIYGQWPPLVNPMRKPGEWQTYDIMFKAARFDAAGKLTDPAYMTVLFNGVLIHDHQKLNGPTGHQVVLPYSNADTEDHIYLQDHGSTRPVRFRNIWVRRLADYDQPEKH